MKTKGEGAKGKGCPDDPGDTADRYVVGQLSMKDAEAFAMHCRECDNCNEELRLARSFAEAVRRAAARLPRQRRKSPRNKTN